MTTNAYRFLTFLMLFCCISSVLYGADDTAEVVTEQDSFCGSCHKKETTAINANGMGHKTDVSCTNCHRGHKPKSFDNIPACNLCHTGTAHYDQLQCFNCHRDPHQPMQIKLPKKAHAECLTCHEGQGKDLIQHQSYHSQLVCTDCHYEHAFMPTCMSCHRTHDIVMDEEHCQDCHAPHKPLEMIFTTAAIPSNFCSPCHPDAVKLLVKTQKKHGQLSCVECHMEQHSSIPQCQKCHGEPHAVAMHTKFPRCGDCHGTAHDLE